MDRLRSICDEDVRLSSLMTSLLKGIKPLISSDYFLWLVDPMEESSIYISLYMLQDTLRMQITYLGEKVQHYVYEGDEAFTATGRFWMKYPTYILGDDGPLLFELGDKKTIRVSYDTMLKLSTNGRKGLMLSNEVSNETMRCQLIDGYRFHKTFMKLK